MRFTLKITDLTASVPTTLIMNASRGYTKASVCMFECHVLFVFYIRNYYENMKLHTVANISGSRYKLAYNRHDRTKASYKNKVD